MRLLTGRHPAAPALDKVETRAGADWLVHPFLIKDTIFPLFFSSLFPPMGLLPRASRLLFPLPPKPNLPPGGLRQAACCWVTREDCGSEKLSAEYQQQLHSPSVRIMISNLNPVATWLHLSRLLLELGSVSSQFFFPDVLLLCRSLPSCPLRSVWKALIVYVLCRCNHQPKQRRFRNQDGPWWVSFLYLCHAPLGD